MPSAGRSTGSGQLVPLHAEAAADDSHAQALSVYSAENGTRLGGPVGLPAFFGVVGPPTNGLSDPYCEPPRHMQPALCHMNTFQSDQ